VTDIAYAPGWPGLPARWTSSAKVGVGSARTLDSRIWFTLADGILTEVYHPRPDIACTRDLGLIVTGEAGFFSEEKRDAVHEVRYLAEGVPAYRLINTGGQHYRIIKDVIADPRRSVVLQQVRFSALRGNLADYHLYALLAPHLGNQGAGNTAWLAEVKGIPMLLAERDGLGLALACSAPWRGRSAGFVGVSDGWQDLHRHQCMRWQYDRAENGNVALTGEVDLAACGGDFVLALALGAHALEAAHHARSSLDAGFAQAAEAYYAGWLDWQRELRDLQHWDHGTPDNHEYRASTMVLRVHEAKDFRGGTIASLSIPWGDEKGDNDLGGYHLVWSRDLVETIGGLLAAGAGDDALRSIGYLQATQEADGHWPQNMWLDGTPYWQGVQMDETAFPIVLSALAWRDGLVSQNALRQVWPMVRRAASYLVRNGPVTQQDRWEEDPGYSPFTLAVEITALLAGADFADLAGEHREAAYLRETADAWNEGVERWTYVTDTDLARRLGVEGYYVRIAPPEVGESSSPLQGYVPIKNRPPGQSDALAAEIVSPDALALVRFGLRAADDPRIRNTVRAVDALLRVETPYGPGWRRYNEDGYGEHADGAAFDGTGIGRVWPLLVGERAHYELAAGRREEAIRLLHTMEAFANEGGMIPEQVWDRDDLPQCGLLRGRPSGSAMPLVWAHAEYLKLSRSLREGRVFDTLHQPVQRYQVEGRISLHTTWRFNHKSRVMPEGNTLRVEVLAPAVIRWSPDGWHTVREAGTEDTGLGVYVADLGTAGLEAGAEVTFTMRWLPEQRWEGRDFTVAVVTGERYGRRASSAPTGALAGPRQT